MTAAQLSSENGDGNEAPGKAWLDGWGVRGIEGNYAR